MYEPGSLSPAEIIDLLTEFGEEVCGVGEGLSDETLSRRPPGHDRSILEICRLLYEESEYADAHLQSVIGEATTATQVTTEATQSGGPGDRPADLMRVFRERRAQTVALLGKLDPSAWQRRGQHPTRGDITVEEVALHLIRVEEQALDEIDAIKRKLGA
jgi:hypothetical protein